MATVFWDVHGVLLVDFTPPGSKINASTPVKMFKMKPCAQDFFFFL
jgi:hypothetical protein